MGQLEKLRESFRACRGPYPYSDFERLLSQVGYRLLPKGKTGGSRRRFVHDELKHLIMLHEPHDGEMGPAMVRDMQQQLEDKGLL